MSMNVSWDGPDFSDAKYKRKKERERYPKVYKTLRLCKRCNANDLCNDEGICSPCNKKSQPSYYKNKTKLVL